MNALGSLLRWAAAGLWTALILVPGILAGLLTFGRYNHRLPNVFAGPWGRGVLWCFGVRLRVVGEAHLRTPGSRVLVSNHQSFLDTAGLSACNPPGVMGLAKREFFLVPIFGQALWALGQVFIDRGDPARARRSLARVAALLARHPRTAVVFPEGTRTRDGRLQPFKMGAFYLAQATGVPLVPCVIYDAWGLVRPDSWRIRQGTVTMVFHPPRDTSGWAEADLHAIRDALHAEYTRWLAEGPPP